MINSNLFKIFTNSFLSNLFCLSPHLICKLLSISFIYYNRQETQIDRYHPFIYLSVCSVHLTIHSFHYLSTMIIHVTIYNLIIQSVQKINLICPFTPISFTDHFPNVFIIWINSRDESMNRLCESSN